MTEPEAPARPTWKTPITDTLEFYRRHPVLLVVALLVGAGLMAGVLTDGGVDLAEAIAVSALGCVVGLIFAAVRSAGSDQDPAD